MLPVQSWAEPGEQVRVSLADATAETRSGEDGRWQVSLSRAGCGRALRAKVSGQRQLEFEDVLVGEV
ncbi:MAG TPA: hypothetical protein EYO90_01860 [Candidatus Latescibacteria bacterium]|jgi:hypothetical protein|nr:hypothetical protein [Candidatus Latescibacterota bacterium]